MFTDITIMIFMEIIIKVFLYKKDLNSVNRIKSQLYLDHRVDSKMTNKIKIWFIIISIDWT